MSAPAVARPTDSRRAAVVITALLAGMVVALRAQGRLWWCACGEPVPWSWDIWTRHNSQHVVDPYSFTHVLHGVLFYGALAWAVPRWPVAWRLGLALALEVGWEVLENSTFVIERYRTATLALEYSGDSIINSVGDVAACALGFFVARRVGLWPSVALFLVTEGVLLLWIRDDLLLSTVMLIYPLEAIMTWQMGG